MAKETLYRCDKQGCNQTRPVESETSLWFLVCANNEAIGNEIKVREFHSRDYDEWNKIFCGEAHALEYISSEIRKLHPSRESGNVCVQSYRSELSPKEAESADL